MFRNFRDSATRPRAIVWTGVAVLLLAVVAVVALGATSTRWFCAEVCHKVQDDTIFAYEASSHSQVSCMACHEPVNANTLVFVLAKMKAVGELYSTVTNKYELPLNAGSALSLNKDEMGSGQCVQCHSANRLVTPTKGVLIDHNAHAIEGITCTTCHNRVAHDEKAAPPKLTSPNGKPNVAHPDFMRMDACMRCHDVTGKKRAPGRCDLCHSSGFDLVPASHRENSWFPKGHAEAGLESRKASVEASAEAKVLEEEGVPAALAAPVEHCSSCHGSGDFCKNCHGLDMPHPKDFKATHGALGKASPRVCAHCHATGSAVGGTEFCNSCHHPQSQGGIPWVKQHPQVVRSGDPGQCFACHSPSFCADCHVNRARH